MQNICLWQHFPARCTAAAGGHDLGVRDYCEAAAEKEEIPFQRLALVDMRPSAVT